MKKEGELRNQLKAVRTRLGVSQSELAKIAGIARQTIGGIEAGTYSLSLSVALRLAKALGCAIEELFWLEGDLPTVEATLTAAVLEPRPGEPLRVSLAQIGGRWVASPLVGDQAFRQEMIPADGIGEWSDSGQSLAVRLLDAPETLAQTVTLAGCTPALSLWARSAERWHPHLRVHWIYANSAAALAALAHSEIHAAGVHLFDARTGEQNVPFVREAMRGEPTVLVTLGIGEEGLLTAPGNPHNLRRGADLAQKGVRLINREPGAGSRLLLDDLLEEDGVPTAAVAGYDRLVVGHREVAREIAEGRADIGVSAASVAAAYHLGFIPVRCVRYEFALRKSSLELAPVQQLLGTLTHRGVRSQLAALGGYDTTQTGEIQEVMG